jgi:hypothetical protein
MKYGIKLAIVFLFILGMISLILGSLDLYKIILFNNYGQKTMGIVDSIYDNTYEGGNVKVYEIRYKDNKGEIYKIDNYFSSDDLRYNKGSLVEVIYLIDDSSNAIINTDVEKVYPVVLAFLFAIVFIFVGILTSIKFNSIISFFKDTDWS